MRVPVFLSAPKCFMKHQSDFLALVEQQLRAQNLEPRTLGRSDYDMDAPLEAIRRLMVGSCGLITLAFRRTYIEKGVDRPASDEGEVSSPRDDIWLTSPYCHIEPAMAFQLGLPLLIWREAGVLAEGILDRGAIGVSMPEFDLSKPPQMTDPQWEAPFREWVRRVGTVYRKRGEALRLWE